MPDTATQIESRIREFIDEMRVLIRQVVLDALSDVLGATAPAKRGPGRPRKTPTDITTLSQSNVPRTTGRRASADVARTIERVCEYIVANPGKGAEHIGPALRVSTRELALPIAKLLASKHIARKGVRRATRYFAGPNVAANVAANVPAPSVGGRPMKA